MEETNDLCTNISKLVTNISKLRLILGIDTFMSSGKRSTFISLQCMSRRRNILGLNVSPLDPSSASNHTFFQVFLHLVMKSPCCRVTRKMKELVLMERDVVRKNKLEVVKRVKKLLTMPCQ